MNVHVIRILPMDYIDCCGICDYEHHKKFYIPTYRLLILATLALIYTVVIDWLSEFECLV